MDPIESLVFGGLSLLGGGMAFGQTFFALRRKRRLEDLPAAHLRSVAAGPAQVEGIAKEEAPLFSPVTHTRCVFFKYDVQEKIRTRRSTRWRTLATQTSSQPFLLEQDGAMIRIDPLGAEVHLSTRFDIEANGFNGLPTYAQTFLENIGIAYTRLGFARDLRIFEWVLRPGTSLYIMGTAKPLIVSPRSLTARISEKVRQLKQNPELMRRLDTNQDGRVCSDEWEVARKKIETWAQEKEREGKPLLEIQADPHFDYLISDQHEDDILAGLRRRIFWGLLGSPALIILGLWLITRSF